MRWSELMTLEFVKIYLKHECLWNPKHPDYKTRNEREKAYNAIAIEFEPFAMRTLTIPEVKLKIKYLRTTYIEQVRKIMDRSTPDCPYAPTLIWFYEMDRCLKDVPVNSRQTILRYSSQEKVEVESSQILWIVNEDNNESEMNEDSEILSALCDSKDDLTPAQTHKTKNVNLKKIKKKKDKKRIPIYLSESIENNETMEDEFDIYGKFIATQLRQMDLDKAIKLQLRIHKLVSEARSADIS